MTRRAVRERWAIPRWLGQTPRLPLTYCDMTTFDTPEFKSRVRSDWSKSLEQILARARELGPSAVLAFDLDSTLFDNRPRQVRILREYGSLKAIAPLTTCDIGHWSSGWDLRAAMRACGMSDAEVEASYAEAKQFWVDRFFTSEYCKDDVPIQGAAAFTRALVAAGAQIAYVTGRHEGMREGTVECMRRGELALPGDPAGRVHLLMKPTLAEDDDAFKRIAHAELATMGTLIAAFDNEPTHVNDYRRKFPEALIIHLATDHSGRPVELLEGIVSVPHFDVRS